MTMFGPLLPGQTAIDDLSGLRLRKIRTVAELNAAESENIRRAMVRYLTARPSPRLARLHHASVRIHPFQNGNGRWARLLANIWLRRHGEAPIEWPEATIGSVSAIRNEYLMAVREADRGEYGRLIAMHVRLGGT